MVDAQFKHSRWMANKRASQQTNIETKSAAAQHRSNKLHADASKQVIARFLIRLGRTEVKLFLRAVFLHFY